MGPRIIIVGAGPAGTRAAETLVRGGLRPTVIDEGIRGGGQIYRRPPAVIERSDREVYGFEAARAKILHEVFDGLADRIDYRPSAVVWSARAHGTLEVLSDSGNETLEWDRLILATGAMDRVVPFEGWTMPGVFTLGGAQIALKFQACCVGKRPVLVGTGPLLYLVAYQYARVGVPPIAVLDTSAFSNRIRALPGLLSSPGFLAKGVYYTGWLLSRGIPLQTGIRPLRAVANEAGHLSEFHWVDAHGRARFVECDAIGVGFNLVSETHLADLCGADFAFDEQQRQWLPVRDELGRATADGVYLAGDGAAIQGAVAAELAGERAAIALLSDIGRKVDSNRLRVLNRAVRRSERFRAALDGIAFPFPVDLARSLPDHVMVCRCENVTAGEIRRAATELGAKELNRAKAFTRSGMGRCQGRVCWTAAAEILADVRDVPLEQVGRLRAQAPVKPVPIGVIAKVSAR